MFDDTTWDVHTHIKPFLTKTSRHKADPLDIVKILVKAWFTRTANTWSVLTQTSLTDIESVALRPVRETRLNGHTTQMFIFSCHIKPSNVTWTTEITLAFDKINYVAQQYSAEDFEVLTDILSTEDVHRQLWPEYIEMWSVPLR